MKDHGDAICVLHLFAMLRDTSRVSSFVQGDQGPNHVVCWSPPENCLYFDAKTEEGVQNGCAEEHTKLMFGSLEKF